jgi:hypothetical protein
VARQIFQAYPVWIYTQSNITTHKHKKIQLFNILANYMQKQSEILDHYVF